ncbi:MAG: hypothetical protein O2985_06745, partial [Proteobacteria bacterium]|nr:hypothetical protein [Pseudomonadota bacterium]
MLWIRFALSCFVPPRTLAVAALALALAGCAAPGEMAGREPFHIVDVTVRLAPGLKPTSAFAEHLKTSVLETAALWGEKGRAKRVVLTVTGYWIYRPGRILVHGDGSL